MNPAWHIRKAFPGDSVKLENCMKSAYAIYEQRMGGIRLPPLDTDYLHEIKHYPTWVVESEASVLGGLIIVFDDAQAVIANIAVDPRFQGQGIGGKLATHPLLSENLALYQHLGWKETARDESRIFMKKRIQAR
jgi:ribosomal protein S18 acetylase RimI-like enzyme